VPRNARAAIVCAAMDSGVDLLRPGEVLADTYEIRAKLGEGGMGQVYEAHDRRLERRVAIKVGFPGTSVADEARALAALRGHPSTVTVHALGEHRGMEYAVMDRIHGVTLERHLERRRTDGTRTGIAEIVRIAAAMADGLAVVHEAGMAHRDVKPGNVILAPNDRVVITDFGIFRPECDRSSSSIVWGTPEYMAPEAATGSVAPGEMFLVDVYALGVVIYEMLTGAPPYRGSPATRVLWMQISAPVPDPRILRPDTPRDLAGLTRGMLAKAPRARPQGMREIAYQLRHIAREPAPASSRFSTIIAEDNDATAAILASLVGEGVRGAEVRVARDGREALEMVLRHPPNLLVVDLHLPVMSGLQLCAQLAATDLPGRCRIVGTSAMAERGELAALEALGCVKYLPKGAECATLLPRLAREAWARAGSAR
jgi:serine/threonine protein kinase